MLSKGRRKARHLALQVLYERELNQSTVSPPPKDEFAGQIVQGVLGKLKEIDALIEENSQHWRLKRMAVIDRNILRMGVYELSYCDDIPATVSINEMVEIAKHFGGEGSAAFVNGILDKIKGSLDRPGKAP